MYHLQNLINRTNVPTDTQNNMNAAEDFLLLLLHTHVVAAASVIQSLNPVSELSQCIVTNFIQFPRCIDASAEPCDDEVYVYATELLLDFMMPSRKGYFFIGSFCLLSN